MWRKDFLLHGTYLWKTLRILTYVFNWLYFNSVSYFFFLHGSLYSSLCMVSDSISSNMDEVLSINPSTKVFIFGHCNVHHNDWLTYSSGTDRSGELCYNFSISNDLTQMVNFPIQIPWLWLSQSCSFEIISFFRHFWSCCYLSFYWLYIKLTTRCSLQLFLCWLGQLTWSFERCSMGGYL